MSFLRHRQTHLSYLRVVGATLVGAPTLIVVMSLRLAIPWWVALQQSPPPLHQLMENLVHVVAVVQRTISGTFLREATGKSHHVHVESSVCSKLKCPLLVASDMSGLGFW